MSQLTGIRDAAGDIDAGDRETMDELVWTLDHARGHNLKVQRYYDQEYTVPDELFRMQIKSDLIRNTWVSGWSTKAVDALASRVRMDGFTGEPEGGEPALDEVLARNAIAEGYNETLASKLIQGCAFAAVNLGEDGHAHVRFHSALDAAAIPSGDYRPGAVAAGMCVARCERTAWSGHRRVPTQVNFYLPGRVIVAERTGASQWTAEAMGTPEPEPMFVALTHLGNRNQPMGRTRITHYVRQICDEAARTMFHMQVLGNFYMIPRLALMGLTDAQFETITSNKMRAYIDSMIVTTRDNESNSVPTFQQQNGASPQPFIDVIQLLAKQFSLETSVPLNSLGVVTDNPSSAEAIEAACEDICDVAERDIASDTAALTRVIRLALAVEYDVATNDLGPDQLAIVPHFKPANMASLAARADAAAKYASIRQGFGDTDVCAEMLGFDQGERQRITAQVRRAQGSDFLRQAVIGGE